MSIQKTLEQTLVSELAPNTDRCFIAKDLHPYSILLHALEPRYNVLFRQFFIDMAIPMLYSDTKDEVMESLRSASRVAITCDSWTSVATDSYVTVTAHYFSDNWQLRSHVLQTRAVYQSHMSAHLELLQDMSEEWELMTKDLVLVKDNTANIVVAAQMGKFPHVRCFAHTLNLASQCALKLSIMSRLLGKIRRIAMFFHRSTRRSTTLKRSRSYLISRVIS